MEPTYAEVDAFLDGLFGEPDPVLTRALERAREQGLPAIDVAPAIGRFLHVLATAVGARRILEVGTLAGYSAVWLARALPPSGRMITLELEPRHAEVARRNLADAGVDDRVEVRVGDAADLLSELHGEGVEPFDLIFIDADKDRYPLYLERVVELVRPGSVIVADNVVRQGRVAVPGDDDAAVVGARTFDAAFASNPRIVGSFLQVVGAKPHDGLAIGTVT